MKPLGIFENILYRVGAVCLLIGLLLRLFYEQGGCVLFAIGVFLFTVIQFRMTYSGNDVVIRRLRTQQLLSGVAFIISAILLVIQSFSLGRFHRNEWVIPLAIATFLQLYTAWRIPQELSKKK